MFGIKRKDKKEKVLEQYIKECRKLGFSDDVILRKLRSIDVSNDFLNKHFKINLLREVINKMPKVTKEEDEDDEITEETEDEEVESEEDEDEPKKKKLVKPVKRETEEEPKITIEQVLRNHEDRLRTIEASLFRLRAI